MLTKVAAGKLANNNTSSIFSISDSAEIRTLRCPLKIGQRKKKCSVVSISFLHLQVALPFVPKTAITQIVKINAKSGK